MGSIFQLDLQQLFWKAPTENRFSKIESPATVAGFFMSAIGRKRKSESGISSELNGRSAPESGP